ncbi:mycorrhiza-induced metalloprotease [Laccaria bicolor S238N-H82]|uniref:Mycorrhiza-induced metalloprotease n=1 Tax=Laccaria bicolor (strain S238N-H82 / ATCC MYA-4686) TaxID=486041 RepID=B0E1M1_LACBS|nr:mycorrhiza-induced metalloprotease [Laccaria bicolor S238N-H82]EDQ99289.1 mycorrhiza-induced metalloprotease [Laccaria bicolor S238N-H82]|eukprot:XP_001890099.1 mycorrhiza-induced metalloprotease [Laccaria bicolor S238N-H82]
MANPLNIALISQNVWPVALKPSGLSKDPTSPPVLKYHFVTALSEGYQKHFEFARDEWRKYTYLEFSETRYPSNSDILITCKDEGGAKSNVGKLQSGKATKMTFGLYGCTQTTFLHEFGHALGFQHEHQRPGRESSGIHFCDKPHSRTPDDMTINQALNTAGIHVPTDDTDSEEPIYIKHLKDKRDTESKKGAKSKKKSDVRTEGDFEDDFEDFLSTVIKEAVEWVANNPSEGNDNPESEEK